VLDLKRHQDPLATSPLKKQQAAKGERRYAEILMSRVGYLKNRYVQSTTDEDERPDAIGVGRPNPTFPAKPGGAVELVLPPFEHGSPKYEIDKTLQTLDQVFAQALRVVCNYRPLPEEDHPFIVTSHGRAGR